MSLSSGKQKRAPFWDTEFGMELYDSLLVGGLIFLGVLAVAAYIGLIALTVWLFSIGSGFAFLTLIIVIVVSFTGLGFAFKDFFFF